MKFRTFPGSAVRVSEIGFGNAFIEPMGVDAQGNVYVHASDFEQPDRLQKYAPGGELVWQPRNKFLG